eukprot:jgi/Mesvir1/13248/Mv18981-RA.1
MDVLASSLSSANKKLAKACESGDYAKAHKLLKKKGADVNYADEYRTTPLHRVAEQGNAFLALLLMDSGASLNVRNKGGSTPLHKATQKGHEQVVEVTTQVSMGRGTVCWLPNGCNKTSPSGGRVQVVHVLLKRAASPNIPDEVSACAPPGVIAWATQKIVEMLIAAGPTLNVEDHVACRCVPPMNATHPTCMPLLMFRGPLTHVM